MYMAQVADVDGGIPVYFADHVIDDLAVDAEGRYIYWTAYDAGFIARLDVTIPAVSHDVIVQSLMSPRALVVDSLHR